MKRSIEINTRQFETSHGKTPRGRGRWAFFVVDHSSATVVEIFTVPSMMKYVDAKVWAKAYVRAEYVDELATGYLDLSVAP